MGNTLKLSVRKAVDSDKHALRGNPINSFSAVIFDMDGLVLDTETTYSIAWQKASAEMGYDFTEDFCLSMSGLHYQAIEQRLISFCGAGFDLKEFNRLSGNYWHQHVNEQGIPVKKGFFNLLDQLNCKEIPFCLATNSRHVNALKCLKLAGLEGVFSILVSRDDVNKAKPAPDIFLSAAEFLHIPIAHCLVLEDSLTGIKAAVTAGAQSVFIPSVFPVDQAIVDLATYYFNDLDELSQIIHHM
jgi:HAD superfamily hydrolase (TIGR01509 family)